MLKGSKGGVNKDFTFSKGCISAAMVQGSYAIAKITSDLVEDYCASKNDSSQDKEGSKK